MGLFAPARLDWERDGADWPNREASRFLTVGAIRWHVQIMGPEAAPAALLLHGAGAASHSFARLAPMLAARWRVIAPDLPGHGFTQARGTAALSLPGMAAALAALLSALGARPTLGVGHSAGAAALLWLALEGAGPDRPIGVNAALAPIQGDALFSPLAKLLFVNPAAPRLFAWQARLTGAAGALLDRTASPIEAQGRALYERLIRNPAHVAGALGMMAHWDVRPLRRRLPDLAAPITLIAAQDDPMVPARVSREAAALCPQGRFVAHPRGGHLLHEVDPGAVLAEIGEGAP